ncbi:OCR-like antirestriction protein [Streptomyces phage Caelum]|uniref:OCR-like antirestriction protein n=1 Tax=Streptomyces phage Caelum TaxID=2530160 RepID=A0A481VZH9_9CAUD|nr:hypothetical protein KGG86_gp72 [Streptomyces phage Caelum]QBI99432.1 OCR-like antirestriction protein [Streptomyces phage Caelum]
MDIIEKINHYDPPTLARLAKCAEPDSRVSEGADFLALVRDKVVDMVQELGETGTPYREAIQDAAADIGSTAEPSVKWRRFVDLSAYKENVTEFGRPSPDTPEGHADLALFFIGFRLASALITEIEEG